MRSFLFSCTATLLTAACGSPILQSANLSPATSAAPVEYAKLLSKYVEPGGVRYAAWHSSPQDIKALEKVTDFFAGTLPPVQKKEALAWHINAYNAWILRSILEKYPTAGPLAGNPLFFHSKRIVISGEKTSFDHLEQKVIRPTFKQPLVHFALNCASESCPPLQAVPFQAVTLDSDLQTLTRAYLNKNPQGVVVEEASVRLSKIFDWYAEDFGGKERLPAFINPFRQSPLPDSAKIEFMDYSWKLNEVR